MRERFEESHFSNASIDVHAVLGLADLTYCKLENATLSLFICDLLPGYSERTLGLNGCLLDLNQDLKGDAQRSTCAEPRPEHNIPNLSESVIRE
jgi:hypothetical protein